ncbi:MAG TPA: YIP1 family protein, partial [Anaerolineales bacterium]|nr:YIP1 family protein [Anaerolineales bacterium]
MNSSAASTGTDSFIQVWIRALTKPSESTYAGIAASPKAKASTAFLWIFLCTFAPALVGVLVSGTQISQRLRDAGVDTGALGGGLGSALVNFLCFTPFAAVLGVLGFIISVGVMQWIAKLFKGQGTFDQMAYTLGAITAPGLLLSAVLTLPSLVPVLGICSGLFSLLLSLYLLVLEVTAIKGVHKFGWGAAIGTFVI